MIKADRFYSQKIRIKSWKALLEVCNHLFCENTRFGLGGSEWGAGFYFFSPCLMTICLILQYYQGKKKMYLKKMSADTFYTKKLTGIVIESFKVR